MKKHLLLCILFLYGFNIFAQTESANLSGIFIEKETNRMIPELSLFFPKLRQLYTCNRLGEFSITSLPYGTYTILIQQEGETIDSIKVVLDKAVVHLDTLLLSSDQLMMATTMINQETAIPSIALESADEYVLDDGNEQQSKHQCHAECECQQRSFLECGELYI